MMAKPEFPRRLFAPLGGCGLARFDSFVSIRRGCDPLRDGIRLASTPAA
jgi:hypothetical protein